ncbi:MAG TPA: ABC transporter ATP-binding protein [Rectinemataceae bacterium]|nr:ABC transporter ATP-binding protein [Rectinemataceae bacterium]
MNHLEVAGLRFKRGDFSLSASFELEKGATGVILGPSGCGKTTLLRCIAGLERQDEGSVFVAGGDIGRLPPERRNIGFIFQDLALFDHMTGRENIEFGLGLRKIPRAEAAAIIESLAEKLKIVSLLDRRPFSMSGGERQRLAFARAISIKPGLLLMDEPLSSLDAPLRRELRAYLRSTLSREGMTALHVTHDVEEALELGDRIFLMNGGNILARGTPQTIYENPPDAWCVRFLGLGSLLPILSMEERSGLTIAVTPFGRFSCASSARAGGSGAGEARVNAARADGDAFFFVPRRAATIGADRIQPLGSGQSSGINVMDAIVERVVFQGNYRRVVLRPALSRDLRDDFGGKWRSPEDLFEMETGLDVAISPEEEIKLSIDPGKCGILPLHAMPD